MTHSFIEGRLTCTNNILEIDDDSKDDIFEFLKRYGIYDNIDLILNIVDLMASEHEIQSSKERIKDILYRRELSANKNFLLEFTVLLISFAQIMGCEIDKKLINEFSESIANNKEQNIQTIFEKVSDMFFEKYNELFPKTEVEVLPENYGLTDTSFIR